MTDPRCITDGSGADGPITTLILKRYDLIDEAFAAQNRSELPLWVKLPPGSVDAATQRSVSSSGESLSSSSAGPVTNAAAPFFLASGLRDHPLRRYTSMAEFNGHDFSYKPLHRPSMLSDAVFVHGGYAVPEKPVGSAGAFVHGGGDLPPPAAGGPRVVLAANEVTCGKWLHVVNLHKARLGIAEMLAIDKSWMWPLKEEDVGVPRSSL